MLDARDTIVNETEKNKIELFMGCMQYNKSIYWLTKSINLSRL